ncbi:SDR family NAD(P)-dependent oxidoreductase [Actinomadura darangshiensis]|uniref:SDR family NAD(P)-dependent oxidoreductase n=1 Tax=Actinomadura darangshiensis TaxID=705336 RepID=UPI00140C0BAB|nr:SDR family NAD(P)-dependent oxidoreductase [Actinomadura darangshiensis]
MLVTGASSGLGEAISHLLAQEGFRVFGTYLPGSLDIPVVTGVEPIELDVDSEESVEHCVDHVRSRAGRIDILVNNAGIMQFGFAEETTMEKAHAVFQTNFFGAVRMINAVLPEMRSRRQGRIVNIGSLAAWVGEPGEAFYSASKRSLASYTETLHHEVWPLGVHVSLVEPGAFKTGILRAALTNSNTIADYDASRESAAKTLRVALKRGHDPRRLAHLILKIVDSPSPRLRYGAGLEAHLLPYLKVLVPQRLFDRIIRRAYGLTKKR